MIFDLERIGLIIKDIEVYMTKLSSFEIKSASDLEDDKNFYSSSMLIFSILNRSIDLAEQVSNDKELGAPMEYKDLFIFLEKGKIISKKISYCMQDFVRKRNKISHRYGKISKEEIFSLIKEMSVVKEFLSEIKIAVKK